jgi:excisionase family DNA binding protein
MEQDRMETQLLTVEEVAALLRVSQKTVYRMVEEGKLQAVRVMAQYRIKSAVLDAFIEAGGTPPPA